MKPLPPSWTELTRHARADVPSPVNLATLLRVLRGVTPVVAGWRIEFERVFASRLALTGCTAAALALMAVAGWQAWSFWQDVLPWAQLLANGGSWMGGVS